MKFQEALKDKNLKKEDLAKQTQKKIEEIENLTEYIKEIEGEFEDFDDEDKKNYEDIKNKIATLDNQLEKSILKFDKEVYEKRLQVFESNRIKGGIQKEPKIEKNIVEMNEQVEVEEKVVEIKEMPKSTIIEEKPKKVLDINEKLSQLKQQVQIDPNKFQHKQQEEEAIEVEAEEFEKKGEVKPKKNSVWFWVIAAGVTIVTYGAVNLMKEKR